MEIQWYPGHMAKTKRLIRESLSLVDVVIELIDARIPFSSKNPDLGEMTKDKKRIIVFNKWDLADKNKSKEWMRIYEAAGYTALAADCASGVGLAEIEKTARALMKEKIDAQKARGRRLVTIRAMVAGIPNVGKSTLINKYANKTVAKVEDRAGVTRNKQWIKVRNDFEIMDTPGVLWHKFDDPKVGLNIAFTGGIKDEIIDIISLACKLAEFIAEFYPKSLQARYNIEADNEEGAVLLEKIGRVRGCLIKGGQIDFTRAAVMLIDEFRAGRLGGMTLDESEGMTI